jgi:ribulose-phosphate 3-epimerase
MCNLENQINQLEENNIKMLHIDILDGYFSPSMPLGFETVKQLRKKTGMFFDCHIMTEKPDYFIGELLDIGVQHVTFHAETCSHIDGIINRLHDAGCRAGVALKPSTPLSILEYVIEKCDSILLMLINPGYASSKNELQMSYAGRKIKELRKMIETYNPKVKVEIDGRVSLMNIEDYGKDMVDIFVCGTTCLNRDDIKGSTARMFAVRKSILNLGKE